MGRLHIFLDPRRWSLGIGLGPRPGGRLFWFMALGPLEVRLLRGWIWTQA